MVHYGWLETGQRLRSQPGPGSVLEKASVLHCVSHAFQFLLFILVGMPDQAGHTYIRHAMVAVIAT